jgi:hypothetical protein
MIFFIAFIIIIIFIIFSSGSKKKNTNEKPFFSKIISFLLKKVFWGIVKIILAPILAPYQAILKIFSR